MAVQALQGAYLLEGAGVASAGAERDVNTLRAAERRRVLRHADLHSGQCFSDQAVLRCRGRAASDLVMWAQSAWNCEQ